MRHFYKITQEKIKKYIFPPVAGLLMACSLSNCDKMDYSSCDGTNLFIKDNLDSLVKKSEKNLLYANKLFNEGIEKGCLEKLSMEQILISYKIADDSYKRANNLLKEKDSKEYRNLSISKDDKDKMKKINRALHGWDFGKAELQKDLEKQDLKVEVYNALSGKEKVYFPFLVFSILGIIAWGGLSRLG